MRVSCTDDLDDSNERNHEDDNSEHQPADAVRPVWVDVVTETDRRVIDQCKHDEELHNQ